MIVDANLYRLDSQIVAEEVKVSSRKIIETAAVVLIAEVEMEIFKLQAPRWCQAYIRCPRLLSNLLKCYRCHYSRANITVETGGFVLVTVVSTS